MVWTTCGQGKYVVLFFYPLDFTFVCPTEITAFSDKHAEFAAINTEVGADLNPVSQPYTVPTCHPKA